MAATMAFPNKHIPCDYKPGYGVYADIHDGDFKKVQWAMRLTPLTTTHLSMPSLYALSLLHMTLAPWLHPSPHPLLLPTRPPSASASESPVLCREGLSKIRRR